MKDECPDNVWPLLQARNRSQSEPLSRAELATVHRNATGEEPPDRASERASIIEIVNAHHALVWVSGQLMVLWKYEQDGTLPRLSRLSDIRAHYKNRQIGKVNPLDAWLESLGRSQFSQLVFRPGAVDVGDNFNLWRGWAVEPNPGNCSLFLEHLRNVICGGDESLFEYVIQWFANLVQAPGQKPGTALAMGSQQGTGKGALYRYVRPIFGVHAMQVAGSELLLGRFNDLLASKLLIFGDEAAWPGDRRGVDKLKSYITEERLSIERKNVPAFEIENHCRFIFASNHVHSAPAEFDDRRFVVLPVDGSRRDDFSYWEALTAEQDNGGPAALLHYLLHEVHVTRNLRRVPKTVAHSDQKLLGLDDVGRFWRRMLMQAEHTLLPSVKDGPILRLVFGNAINPATLHEFYLDWCRRSGIHYRASLDALARASRRYIGELNRREAWAGERRDLGLPERARVYALPDLLVLRSRFEAAIGNPLDWGDGDPDQESM